MPGHGLVMATAHHIREALGMTDKRVGLNEKLVPLLREYDLPESIMALSFQLMSATELASKATKINSDLQIALEYAEQKTFWINDGLKKILAKK
jgi:hypothetical protein